MSSKSQNLKYGSVSKKTFFSSVLGIEKQYNIYLPPRYNQSEDRYPVLYLFRGHEDEWFDPYMDHSRGGNAIQHLADELIQTAAIGKMIIVGVSMTSDDGQVYGLGMNMLNPKLAKAHNGIGSGKFEDYFTQDFIPHIDSTYRTIADRAGRGMDGFSLGGYTSVMLAIKYPQLFSSVGSYDGSHMFRDLNDPRLSFGKHDDYLWVRNDKMFAPVFRKPGKKKYDISHLLSYNPLNILDELFGYEKGLLQSIRFYIKTAAFDGFQGNRDRGVHLVTLFQLHGIENHASSLILSSDAHHTWKFADLHMRETLKKHSEAFGVQPEEKTISAETEFLTNVELISVKETTPLHKTITIDYRVYKEIPIKVEILSMQGESIKTLKQETHACGRHQIEWKGLNATGHLIGSGLYFVLISTPTGAIRKKFLFLR